MTRGKILIADDEPDIRELLGDFLEDEGYECILASDAFDAIDKFKSINDIDLIMSDIRMPGKSGLELLSELKTLDNDIMVVMISAVKDIEFAISAMSKGAYDYVSKPFKLNEVSLIAKKAVDKRRLLKENKKYQADLEKKVTERTKELKGALEELDKTYSNTLRALVYALDTRDTETQGHSMRVVRYSLLLAEILGLKDEHELKTLEYGALLHDIGKIGIPDAILRKPGKLSPEEWQTMQTHPILGYNILNRIEYFKDASYIVLHHHERYDGSGYPSRLYGNKIPIGARIYAVADTVDAMTSERPYRKALTFEIASAELIKGKSTQFDPDAVDAFHSMDLEFWKNEKRSIDNKMRKFDIFRLKF